MLPTTASFHLPSDPMSCQDPQALHSSRNLQGTEHSLGDWLACVALQMSLQEPVFLPEGMSEGGYRVVLHSSLLPWLGSQAILWAIGCPF